MGRIRALLLSLVGAMLTALFVWLLLDAQWRDQNLAIGGVLFFGACTLAALSFLFPARIPPAEADGATTIPNSAFRCFAIALALIAVTVSAFLMWPSVSRSGDWRSFAFLLIPIPCAWLAYKYLQWTLSGRPAYRFDSIGVTRYQWGERTTPWAAVTGVRIIKFRGSENVVLDVTPEQRRKAGWLSRLGASTGFGDVTLPTATSGVSPKDLERLVRQYWRPA